MENIFHHGNSSQCIPSCLSGCMHVCVSGVEGLLLLKSLLEVELIGHLKIVISIGHHDLMLESSLYEHS